MHKKLAFYNIFMLLVVREMVSFGGRINNCQGEEKTLENEATEGGKEDI